MKITGIIWLARFVEKLARKHNVSVEEVEQVLAKRPRIQFVERGDIEGEDLYCALGRTDAGRYLVVFFVYKGTSKALVISTREKGAGEKKSYAKGKK